MIDIYKASAGSGKTYTLAREYILMLLRDMPYKQGRDMPHKHILAVTFTKKATGEMKHRILNELFQLARHPQQSPYKDYLEQQLTLPISTIQQMAEELLIGILQDYNAFAVTTIDSFFQQVVRRFARELNLNAQYDLMLDSEEVVEMAVDSLMQRVRTSSKNELGQWLIDFSMQHIEDDTRWDTKDDLLQLSHQLMQEKLRTQLHHVQSVFADKQLITQYRQTLQDICDTYLQADKTYQKDKANKQNYISAGLILDSLYPLGVLQDVANEIASTNRRLNRLPIAEINSLLTDLIDEADTPFIYEKMGQWLHHYLIDEFQDTSTLQWRNFRPLIAEAEAHNAQNLIVGDIKQSIYRWRNSNWRLLENIPQQFAHTRQPRMDSNFRSSPVVVQFNNDFFSRYRDYIATQLDKDFASNPVLAQTVRTIYADERLHQKAQKKTDGYVRMQFYEGKADELKEQCLQAILPILASIRSRGGHMGDVAILIRKKSQAHDIAALLTQNGYSVQSGEGLLLQNDPCVQLILILLQKNLTLEQDQPESILTYRLQQLTLSLHLNGDEPSFSDEQSQSLRQLAQLPLYEQVQAIIQLFSLHQYTSSQAYLISLLDRVYQFTCSRSADPQAFLEYWQRNAHKLSIPAAHAQETIQILTIHASKGLEFKYVILPYVNWELCKGPLTYKDILWCIPKQPPFDTLPLVPVHTKDDLKKSIFQEEYEQEILNLYIDNINLTYVAFTRAEQEMYLLAGKPSALKSGELSIRNIGNLLYSLFSPYLSVDQTLSFGQPTHNASPQTASSDDTAVSTLPNQYVFSPAFPRLRLRRHQNETTDKGNRMHDLLSRIRLWDDEPKALQSMLTEGVIREEQKEEMHQLFLQFRQLVKDYPWFEADARVLLEEDIITPSGDTYRPDRVVIRGKEAIVIDYKFGEIKKRSYHYQVANYMALLRQMGYQTKGYLVYVSLLQIDEVK